MARQLAPLRPESSSLQLGPGPGNQQGVGQQGVVLRVVVGLVVSVGEGRLLVHHRAQTVHLQRELARELVGHKFDTVAVGDGRGDQRARQRRLELLLHGALERPRAVLGAVAALGQRVERLVGGVQRDAPLGGPPLQRLDLQAGDGAQLRQAERVEDDHLVETVEELGAVALRQRGEHLLAHLASERGVALGLQHVLRARVGGEDDDGVLEVDDAALPAGGAAVVEDLQQHVEDVGVRLVHLVEEHH